MLKLFNLCPNYTVNCFLLECKQNFYFTQYRAFQYFSTLLLPYGLAHILVQPHCFDSILYIPSNEYIYEKAINQFFIYPLPKSRYCSRSLLSFFFQDQPKSMLFVFV